MPLFSLTGNRSPLADVEMRGMLIGMQLDKTVGDLALRYYATGEAIALQTRQIIDVMNESGHKIDSIFMSGGLVKNKFLMAFVSLLPSILSLLPPSHLLLLANRSSSPSLIADVCDMPVQLPYSHSASVVIGSAMLGAAAAEEQSRLQTAVLEKQEEAEKSSYGMKDKLWETMVRLPSSSLVSRGLHLRWRVVRMEA
jgi:ribulose kinase